MTAGSPARLRETIIASLDDIAAAVDGFSSRLNAIEVTLVSQHARLERLVSIQDRLTEIENKHVDLENRLIDMNSEADQRHDRLKEEISLIGFSVESIPGDLKDELGDIQYDLDELAEQARRAERQEWLMGARDAMGRGRVVKLVM